MKRHDPSNITTQLAFTEDTDEDCITAVLHGLPESPCLFGTVSASLRTAGPELFNRWMALMEEVADLYMLQAHGSTKGATFDVPPGEQN